MTENDKNAQQTISLMLRCHRKTLLLLCFVLFCPVIFVMHVYQFLAVPSSPVPSDILVIEGWVPDYVLQAAMEEFRSGDYKLLLASGQRYKSHLNENRQRSISEEAVEKLVSFGLDRSKLLACPCPNVRWNQTSTSAVGVREAILAEGINPRGINVVTVAPHARQSWLAYRRIMSSVAPVGIVSVSVLKESLQPETWWRSIYGWRVITKLFSGWLREAFFGLR